MYAIVRAAATTILTVIALCCFVGVVVCAPWYEEYAEARKALERRDWQTALDHLNNAIEQRQEPKARVRTYGTNYVQYIPYLMRGFVNYNLGNYEEASVDFETSRSYGVVKNLKNRPRFARRLSEIVADTERKLQEKNTQQASTASENEPDLPVAGAEGKPESGVGPVENGGAKSNIAERSVKPPPGREENGAISRPAGAPASRKDVTVSETSSTSQQTKTQQNSKLLDQAIVSFQQGSVGEANVAFATILQESPEDSVALFYNKIIGELKAETRSGVTAYFGGDYASALKSLSSAIEKNDKIGALHFLLGAVYWTEFRLSGDGDQDLQGKAILSFRNAKRLSPGYRPNEEFFSPLMLSTFDDVEIDN